VNSPVSNSDVAVREIGAEADTDESIKQRWPLA
jgi:hypothetical protein